MMLRVEEKKKTAKGVPPGACQRDIVANWGRCPQGVDRVMSEGRTKGMKSPVTRERGGGLSDLEDQEGKKERGLHW